MAEFQFPVLDAREKGGGRGFSGRFGGQRAGLVVHPLRVFKEFPCFFPVNALSKSETGSVKLRRQPRILEIVTVCRSPAETPRLRTLFARFCVERRCGDRNRRVGQGVWGLRS